MRRLGRSPVGIAAVGALIGVILVLRLLVEFGWDPTAFAAFGEDSIEINARAEELLGREVLTRADQGHDGKFFFIQANDPWVQNPEENAAVLDRAIYRSQRMMYPVLVSVGGLLGADAIIWTLIATNVAMLALGTWAVASIGVRHKLSAWAGLAFALNFGLVTEIFIDGAGITAFAFACLGALALEEDKPWLAAAAFGGAVLTREVMALFVAFVALFWFIRRRKIPWSFTIPPALALIAWAGYIRLQIPADPDVNQIRELTVVPFSGMIKALTSGLATPTDYLVIVTMVGLIAIVAIRAWSSDLYLSWGSAGFCLLAPFLALVVWQKTWDITRALAPLVTVFILEFMLSRNRSKAELERSP